MSPSDTVEQLDEKVQDWLEHGATAVWVVSPKWKSVTVYSQGRLQRSLQESDILEDAGLLPGFRCLVSELFAID